jgi:hypothetical protein
MARQIFIGRMISRGRNGSATFPEGNGTCGWMARRRSGVLALVVRTSTGVGA